MKKVYLVLNYIEHNEYLGSFGVRIKYVKYYMFCKKSFKTEVIA